MTEGQPDRAMEEAGRREVLAALETAGHFMDQVRALQVSPGGALDRADTRTDYAPISTQIRWQLQIAADHIAALSRLVLERGQLPHYSGYVLIRAALEACTTALWLMGPAKPAQRILRSLRLSWWFAGEANRFASDVGFDIKEQESATKTYLNGLRLRVKELRQSTLEVTQISRTNMFLDVERRFEYPARLKPVHVWRVCSSLAHGNSAMATMALKRKAFNPDYPNVEVARSSWALMATFLRSVVWMFNRAIERFEELAGAS